MDINLADQLPLSGPPVLKGKTRNVSDVCKTNPRVGGTARNDSESCSRWLRIPGLSCAGGVAVRRGGPGGELRAVLGITVS